MTLIGEQSFGHSVEVVTLRITAIGADDITDRMACRSCAPTVTADHGYGYVVVDAQLHEPGYAVAIPRASKASSARRELEHREAFRAKIKWLTTVIHINHLKRGYRWNVLN